VTVVQATAFHEPVDYPRYLNIYVEIGHGSRKDKEFMLLENNSHEPVDYPRYLNIYVEIDHSSWKDKEFMLLENNSSLFGLKNLCPNGSISWLI
jgi:hypothetical protein